MKQLLLTLLILASFLNQSFAQSDSSSVYGKLETKKFYAVGTSMRTENGISVYEVNGEKVSKASYEKYHNAWDNMANCCPCILESYDINEVLLRRAVSCTDCVVGFYEAFYPNGKIKESGSYKENPTDDWEDIEDRGLCHDKKGLWVYFDEKGDTLYTELWDKGDFIEQVPEQDTLEIWKIDLILDGVVLAEQKKIKASEVSRLKIKPYFKNSRVDENNFTIEFEVGAIGFVPVKKTFTLGNFNTIDVRRIMKEAGIPEKSELDFNFKVYYKGRQMEYFDLNVKL